MNSQGRNRTLLKALGFGLAGVALFRLLMPAEGETGSPSAGVAVEARGRGASTRDAHDAKQASAPRPEALAAHAPTSAPTASASPESTPQRAEDAAADTTSCHVATDCVLTGNACPIAVRRDALTAARQIAATTAGDAACENATITWNDMPATATLKASCRAGACITVRSEMFRREPPANAEFQAARGAAAKAGRLEHRSRRRGAR